MKQIRFAAYDHKLTLLSSWLSRLEVPTWRRRANHGIPARIERLGGHHLAALYRLRAGGSVGLILTDRQSTNVGSRCCGHDDAENQGGYSQLLVCHMAPQIGPMGLTFTVSQRADFSVEPNVL